MSGFRGCLDQELKYADKGRWMECPDELNPDSVTPLDDVGDSERYGLLQTGKKDTRCS